MSSTATASAQHPNTPSEQFLEEPFPHLLVSGIFPEDRADALLDWFETDARWRFQQTSFYQQYSCSNIADVSEGSDRLLGAEFINAQRERLERTFDVALDRERIYACAHRLIRGTGIGIHTDRPGEGRETHRLVVHLARDFEDANGGHLMFFGAHDFRALHSVVRPLHNSAAAFALSNNSFHAVNEVTAGVRYSIVFSFWRSSVEADLSVVPSPEDPPMPQAIEHRSGAAVGERTIRLLRRLGAHTVAHSGRTLFDHLVGTAHILAAWDEPPSIVVAGLIHSIYATAGFPLALAAFSERALVRAAAGSEAEELAFHFSTGPTGNAAAHLQRGLAIVSLANALEQRGRPQANRAEDVEILAMLDRDRALIGSDITRRVSAQLERSA